MSMLIRLALLPIGWEKGIRDSGIQWVKGLIYHEIVDF